ncbi:hypothetical protein KFZ56_16010 [Virgibacillus sp. NKC19-3]|uniref:hypothetical protein n=1 Tax=Virgibacillus saliphilus TaxID=2831674 RepID=UPI001C9A87A8|nr:hypothetical protein [Virgibacillus sp. NKC19-3]MBY7144529.1 hypothetical protein [Virgibacillus sp. NKC19-3]
MFQNPLSILEHFAQPIFIGLLTVTILLLFGTFLAHFLIMVPFKRLRIYKMELEFNSNTLREKQIANQFLYSSTMLHNHTENVKYLIDNQLMDLKQVLQFLAYSYKNYSLQYNNELTLEIDVLEPTELKGRERKLYQAINGQNIIKANTTYENRLIQGDNLLLGTANVGEDSDKATVVVRREYDYPFDTYDQETLESIIGYAVILFDTAIMIQLFHENGMYTEDNEIETD